MTLSIGSEFVQQQYGGKSVAELIEAAEKHLRSYYLANYLGDVEAVDDAPLPDSEAATVIAALSIGLNRPFRKARGLVHLWTCKELHSVIDERLGQAGPEDSLKTKWTTAYYRFLHVWQDALPDIDMGLYEKLVALMPSVEKTSELALSRFYTLMMLLRFKEARELLDSIAEDIQLKHELTGIMGVRTKYQTKPTSQLVALATNGRSDGPNSNDEECHDLPSNINIDDDTVLEEVKTVDGEEVNSSPLHSDQLACLFATALLNKKVQAKTDEQLEIMNAYCSAVIGRRRNWAITVRALIERSITQSQSTRRVFRTVLQMEHVVKLLDNVDDTTNRESKKARWNYAMATGTLPWWKVKSLYGVVLESVGSTNEALAIYESIEDYEKIIACYKSLNKLENAERLIRSLLAEEEDPVLYTHLGDITDNSEYYEKAIEISNDRCAKARKSYGMQQLLRKKYNEASEHFKRCVEIQPIQVGVWYNLGYTYYQQERFADAAPAFHRCTQLEPDHFHAWNNLACCYVNMKEKERAYLVYQEAVKCDSSHDEVWANLASVAIEQGALSKAIEAINQVIDLRSMRGKEVLYDEVPALKCLASMLLQEPEKFKRQKEDYLVLLGKLTTKQTCGAHIWRVYAEMKRPEPSSTDPTAWDLYIQKLQRCASSDMNAAEWRRDEDIVLDVLTTLLQIADGKKKIAELKDNAPEATRACKSWVRLTMGPVVSSLRKIYTETELQEGALKEALENAEKAVVEAKTA
ncbi:hypothetical protein QR680_014712 [Steinernema hermaphroditum]|uniref:Tetratricopeptide repeat protein n=1 Tax=Steinernema hermaphroditum TaxID=289476 RepID=A0AA39M4R1_9BILA|nr:hypothetical protein QR680_014712 [Steinernema hermaphroditum]